MLHLPSPHDLQPLDQPCSTSLATEGGASLKTASFAKLIVYYNFHCCFYKYVLIAPFAVLIMTWCKQLLLIGLFLMSLFLSPI